MSLSETTPIVTRHFDGRFALMGPRGGAGRQVSIGFSQVVMPPFRLDGAPTPPPKAPAVPRPALRDDPPDSADASAGPRVTASPNLVLRRGHTGSPDLYELWRAERDRERHRLREVTVLLLDGELRPVTAWQFRDCHIVGLEYSPLDALDVGVLMETLEVSFESFDQFAVGD